MGKLDDTRKGKKNAWLGNVFNMNRLLNSEGNCLTFYN